MDGRSVTFKFCISHRAALLGKKGIKHSEHAVYCGAAPFYRANYGIILRTLYHQTIQDIARKSRNVGNAVSRWKQIMSVVFLKRRFAVL